MRKQRARALVELYEITQRILEPEITPILKGSCRIQGPGDEVDLDIESNLAVLPTEKEFGKCYLNEDILMKASGTCNVCAAPCSSCMHYNRTISFMESKAEGGTSENSCGRKDTDNCSISNSEMPLFYKSKSCDGPMQAVNETNKVFSTTSSHDSYSENAESKGTVKNLDVHDVSESVDMPLKLTSFETVEENQLLEENNVSSQSPKEPADPIVVQGTFSIHQGDPHGLECHGDNISCVTGLRDVNLAASDASTNLVGKNMPPSSALTYALHVPGFKMAVQGEASNSDIVEVHGTIQRSGKCAQESSQRKGSCSNPLNAALSHDNSESPSSNGPSLKGKCSSGKPSSKEKCLHSNTKIGNSLYSVIGSRDTEENSSSQLQVQPPQTFMEPVESALGWQKTTGGMDEQKFNSVSHITSDPNDENGKASDIALNTSSPNVTYQCSETKTVQTGGNDGNATDVSIKHCVPSEQHGKHSSSMETSNVPAPHPESQPRLEGACPDPDPLDDDVKICDICGDAGREDLLAICSRCSDGAEHTYCMRIMLEKVPENDWLCEECKLKDVVTDKVEKPETVSGSLKAPCPTEKAQRVGSSLNPKLLPKLDVYATDMEAQLPVKGPQSPQISAKRLSGNTDATLLTNKKPSDTVTLAASPSRKSNLSRESSFKNLDAGKAKQGNFAPSSGCQSSTSSQGFSHSLTTGSNSSRVVGQLQHPRGLISRSGSFNSLKPRVKQIIEHVLQKPKVSKEHAVSDTKEGFVKTLGKSTSFKNINSGQTNVIESIKSQSACLHRPEESRNLQQSKERIIERKNSFVRTSTGSSLASAPNVSLSKAESKSSQNDGKVNSLSEPSVSHPNKASDNSHDKDKGVKELKKQESHASKLSGTHPSNGACNFADQRPIQALPREDTHVGCNGDTNTIPQRIMNHSCNRDEKLKDSSSVGGSRSLLSASKRILRCQRCNETGHSTQFCSVDKLRVSALKPSVERNSREAANKGNKWKDAVDAAILKSRMQKNLPDPSEEISSTDLSSEIVSMNHSSSASGCAKDLPTTEGTVDKQNNLRNSVAGVIKTAVSYVKQHDPQMMGNVKHHDPQMMGNVCTNKDGESNPREELKIKTSMQILPEHHSILFDPSRISALPGHEYIWQGSFEVKRAGRLPELCDGFQAHLSTCASPKVLNVVKTFPDKVQLEEVTRLSCWPLQFQEKGPTEENIALFFFAKDVSSYEKSYSKLLETMLRNDLALKGNFDGIELLIFPSSKLPGKSQHWNRLLFLWGVFRERKVRTCSCPQSKACISNHPAEHVDNGVPMQLVTKVSIPEKESSHENMSEDASRNDKPMNTGTDDLKNSPFLGAGSGFPCMDKSFHQSTSIQGPTDNKLDSNRNTSKPIVPTNLLPSGQTSSQDVFPKPTTEKSTAPLCMKLKSSCSSTTCQIVLLKEFNLGPDGRKDHKLPSFQSSDAQIVHSVAANELSSMDNITSDPEPPDLNVDLNIMNDAYSESTGNQQLNYLSTTGSGIVGIKDEEKMDTGKFKKGTASDSAIAVDKIKDGRWVSGTGNMKRTRSCSPQNFSQSSGGTSVGMSADMLWRRGTEYTSPERECKKMKIQSEVPSCSSSGVDPFGDKSSSKVHPLLANFLNEQLHTDNAHSLPTLPDSSINSERRFFPLDSSSVVGTKTGNMIPLQILSSDDEYEPPNLELALGADKRQVKQEIQPLSLPLVDKNKSQEKLPLSATLDDESASLSLSLAFPFSGKKQMKTPVPKAEELLPKRPQVNTSLILFGGFADS